jgi:vacuolar-type H+-ATPase subunit D/Vma8
MIDPFDQLIRQSEELIAQKQMLLTLASSHNRLNAQNQALQKQFTELLDAVEKLTAEMVKNAVK